MTAKEIMSRFDYFRMKLFKPTAYRQCKNCENNLSETGFYVNCSFAGALKISHLKKQLHCAAQKQKPNTP